MTTLEFAKENREQVIENCPEGVNLNRYMNEFLVKFNATAKSYGSVCYPAFYEAIDYVVETIRTDDEISGIKANNFLREHNAEVSRKMAQIR